MIGWKDIARLISTKRLQGGLVAKAAAGLPFLLHEGMRIALVPPVLDAPRFVTVASVGPCFDDEAEVQFQEVSDRETASMLVGCHCLAQLDDDVISESDAMPSVPHWEGWQVVDEVLGPIGVVSEIHERPAQNLLVVEGPDGHEVLVPLAEELIIAVDPELSQITMKLPAGLLEL